MTIDAPDWQRIVTTVLAAGDVPDAPDWERIVVGPAGVPVGPGAGFTSYSPYIGAGYIGLTADPYVYTAVTGHNAGVMSLTMFTALVTGTARFITMWVGGAQSTTANENFVALYDTGQHTAATATLLGASAAGAADVPFATNGLAKIALSSSVPLTAGQNYFAGFLSNQPSAVSGFANIACLAQQILNPVGTTYPIRGFGTGPYTTPPASLAFSAFSLTVNTWLQFVS